MIKVFNLSSPIGFVMGLGLLIALFFVGLPLLLILACTFIFLSILRSLFSASTPKRTQKTNRSPERENSFVSPIIHNKRIGDYRVIENPNDPSVIEVEKV